mgnify:CR=1 FL=1
MIQADDADYDLPTTCFSETIHDLGGVQLFPCQDYSAALSGDFYLCTAQFSDLQKIQVQMAQTQGLNQGEKVFEKPIPFSRRLLENIDNLDPKHYNKKGSRYFWNFGLWRMGLL